jgi:hypothetical protein
MNLLRPRSCPCDRPCLSLSLAGLGYTTGFAVPHVRMRISLAFSAVRSIAAVYWASWWPNNAHVRTVPSRPPTRFAMHAYITGAWRMRARAELLVVTPPRLAAGRPACLRACIARGRGHGHGHAGSRPAMRSSPRHGRARRTRRRPRRRCWILNCVRCACARSRASLPDC